MGSPAQVIPPPPPGFKLDGIPPPPPGFKVDAPSAAPSPMVGDFVGGAWSKLNPVTTLRGMADTLESLYKDPAGTAGAFAKEVLAHPYTAFARGVEAAKAGKPQEAMAHFANALEPAGFMTEGSEVKAATPGKRAEGAGEMLGIGLNAYLMAKAPDIAAGIKAKAPEVWDKLKDVAVPAGKGAAAAVPELPILPKKVGDLVAPVKAARKGFTAARDAQAAAEVQALPAGPPPLPADPLLEEVAQRYGPEAAHTIADRIRGTAPGKSTAPAADPNFGRIDIGEPVKTAPAAQPPAAPAQTPAARTPEPAPSGPPSAWLDQETTGLPNERMMANRAAKAQRFIKALGGTQNLPTNQSEWVRVANELGEKPPSLETQAQIEFGLNRRMFTKTETPGTVEIPKPAVAKNPKALKIAQQLQAEMQRSESAPSMPVAIKGNAVDIESVGPGATVTLKNGKTVVVKQLHPDGTFEY